jgi:hypothetical protein
LIGGTPKLIQETNGWHVLGGQRIPLSVAADPVQLQCENGHFSQTYKSMFYANPNSSMFNYARCNAKGDSVYMKQADNVEYNPFFYFDGDAKDVRYGVYFPSQSTYGAYSRVTTGIYGIGPDALDVNTKLFEYPPFYGGYPVSPGVFANPHWFVYWNKQTAGLTAYRIGTAQQIDMGGFYQNDYVILFGASAITIDEAYSKANPTHVKAYFYGSNNGTSVWGHSSHYLSFYTADDQNKTIFRDSTSQYITPSGGVSCSDANNVYYLFSNATKVGEASQSNHKLLVIVFDKTTMKITRQVFSNLDISIISSNPVIIPSKNQIYFRSTLGIFKLSLTDYSITNITPKLVGDTGNSVPNLALATDGKRLYATIGSSYMKYTPAVTNVIYYE